METGWKDKVWRRWGAGHFLGGGRGSQGSAVLGGEVGHGDFQYRPL